MPYLMRGRNESCVYQESLYRIAGTRTWLKAYNRTHHPRATLFHLVAYATAVAIAARPRLNRFVSGGRLYQRKGVFLSFVAKTLFKEGAANATVKLESLPLESFLEFSTRISTQVEEAREMNRPVDAEVKLLMYLPGTVVRLLLGFTRCLDHWNLYPGFMIRDDPMYATVFLANLGSVGVSDAYHHLFEYGTVSIFGAVSAPRRAVFPGKDGPAVHDALTVRWTFDERIDDAYACARCMALVQNILEDPARWLGPPEGSPTYTGTEWTAEAP